MNRSMFVVAGLAGAILLSFSADAQITKGNTRPARTKQIMIGLVKPNGTAITNATKKEPADDKAWEALATNAALLNEASYILMDDGRCPDDKWADAAKALRAATETVLAKIDAKDIKGVEAEIKNINQACAACHRAHKK